MAQNYVTHTLCISSCVWTTTAAVVAVIAWWATVMLNYNSFGFTLGYNTTQLAVAISSLHTSITLNIAWMRPFDTHVARNVLCASVCVYRAQQWALQKRQNWSRYCMVQLILYEYSTAAQKYNVFQKGDTKLMAVNLLILNFQFFFTIRLSGKFPAKHLLKTKLHLICVATLPCETLMSENERQSQSNVPCSILIT